MVFSPAGARTAISPSSTRMTSVSLPLTQAVNPSSYGTEKKTRSSYFSVISAWKPELVIWKVLQAEARRSAQSET